MYQQAITLQNTSPHPLCKLHYVTLLQLINILLEFSLAFTFRDVDDKLSKDLKCSPSIHLTRFFCYNDHQPDTPNTCVKKKNSRDVPSNTIMESKYHNLDTRHCLRNT